jgi:aminoglycoside phosphotransferase (APT) family kinase protein
VVNSRRLTGGLVSSVHALSIQDNRGRPHQVVLRRFLDEQGDSGAARQVRSEAKVLQALANVDLPAPSLIAFDPEGLHAGVPSLLMNRVAGHIQLNPKDPEDWLDQMAATLARIHSTSIELAPPARRGRWREPEWEKWAPRPLLWREAYAATVNQQAPVTAFIHGDYQHFNQLWSRSKLVGIVDWSSAGMGCPDSDVGHCRLNLAVLFSPEWAEGFREAYESATARKINPVWDLSELVAYSPDWEQFIPIQVAGRIAVDSAGMTARVEALIESALKRL